MGVLKYHEAYLGPALYSGEPLCRGAKSMAQFMQYQK